MQVAISAGGQRAIIMSLSLCGKVTSAVAAPRKRSNKAVVQIVRRDHLDAVLATIREPYRTMMILQWAVGLRPGEACKMRLTDLDLERGELITPRDGKTGERRVSIDPAGQCAETLAKWLGKRPEGPYLFGGVKPIRVNTYNIAVHRACDRAGVPHFRPYALRHTYATDLIHEQQAISDISLALGHSSVLTTARYYLHADPEMLRRLNKGR